MESESPVLMPTAHTPCVDGRGLNDAVQERLFNNRIAVNSGGPIMVQVNICRDVLRGRAAWASLPPRRAVDDTRKVW
jgi:hypothetical protein